MLKALTRNAPTMPPCSQSASIQLQPINLRCERGNNVICVLGSNLHAIPQRRTRPWDMISVQPDSRAVRLLHIGVMKKIGSKVWFILVNQCDVTHIEVNAPVKGQASSTSTGCMQRHTAVKIDHNHARVFTQHGSISDGVESGQYNIQTYRQTDRWMKELTSCRWNCAIPQPRIRQL